jgi:uncharacterized membrane protein
MEEGLTGIITRLAHPSPEEPIDKWVKLKRKPPERKQFGQLAPETLERLMDELRGAKMLEGEGALQKHMRSVNRAVWQRRTTMDAKSYSRVAAVIFAVIALLQLFRALAGWELTVNSAAVPLWASWLAAVVAGALAVVGLTAS